MNDEAGFLAAIGSTPDDRLAPLVYADWLDERNDSRGQLLRVWAVLSWRASHAGSGFRELLSEYRRLMLATDPAWRRAFAAARPWIDAPLAEELCRGYLRYVRQRTSNQRGVIPGGARWCDEFDRTPTSGWLIPYWLGQWYSDRRGRRQREWSWFLFVEAEYGWVYLVSTGGTAFLDRYDVASGEGHAF